MSNKKDAYAGLIMLGTIEHKLKLWENSVDQCPEIQEKMIEDVQSDLIWLLYYVNSLKEGLED